MTIGRKTLHLIITVISSALCLAAIFAVLRSVPTAVFAEETQTVELAPIELEDSDIVYRLFDSPNSVYADEMGIIVAGENSIEFVSGENSVTSAKAVGADKIFRVSTHEADGGYIVVLSAGKLITYRGDEAVEFSTVDAELGAIEDFCCNADKLYAITSDSLIVAQLGANGIDTDGVAVSKLTSDRHARINANAVATLGGHIYISVDSVSVRKNDICTADLNGVLDVAIPQSDNILCMTASDTLYTLTRGDIVRYEQTENGGLYRKNIADGDKFTNIFAFGQNLYALDSLNALHKLSADLGTDNTLIASGSDALGFFDMPTDIAAKNSVLYVADTLNGRIVEYSDGAVIPKRKFTDPVSVAADSAGKVYIAYERDKVGIFSSENLTSDTETAVTGFTGTVKQLAVDAEKSLYILTDTGLWKAPRGDKATLIDSAKYKAITLGVGRDTLYALSEKQIVKFDASGNHFTERPAPEGAVAIAADMNDTLFVLTADKIIRIKSDSAPAEFTLACDGKPYTLGSNAGKIILCSVQNKYVSHGDIIILDTFKHRLMKTSGLALDAQFVDENYDVPSVSDDTVPSAPADGIIRTVIRDTRVYAFPMESQSVFTVVAGHRVIVPYYEIAETREYSLILIDDTENNRLVQGYVYRDSLSAAIEYGDPPSAVCTVFSEVTPVYKWPSRFSKPLDGHAAVVKNTKFDMLSFVDPYKDDFGYYWYRIALEDGNEGYIPAVNITTSDYNRQNILPDYNAEIISYNGSSYAPAYSLGSDGKYTRIEGVDLKTGVKVEVVGAYDSSKRYTQIKFLDVKSHQTVTCYVQTVYIKYNGVNIVLIVAVIVIIITVILAAVIITRSVRAKKKRLERENYRKNDETED